MEKMLVKWASVVELMYVWSWVSSSQRRLRALLLDDQEVLIFREHNNGGQLVVLRKDRDGLAAALQHTFHVEVKINPLWSIRVSQDEDVKHLVELAAVPTLPSIDREAAGQIFDRISADHTTPTR